MKTYRIATSAELDDGTTRDAVFDIVADHICISRKGGIRAYRDGDVPEQSGWWARWRQERQMLRDSHLFDELVAWVPSDALVSVRCLTPPGQDETIRHDVTDSTSSFATGGVVAGPIIHRGA